LRRALVAVTAVPALSAPAPPAAGSPRHNQLMRVLLIVVVLLAVLVVPAGAVPPRTCDPVGFHGHGYTVTAHGVKCRFARKWVKRYLKAKKHPKGYHCLKPSSGSNVKVNCQGSTKPSGDPTYRYYYGIRQ
jgi:hypothetical protein